MGKIKLKKTCQAMMLLAMGIMVFIGSVHPAYGASILDILDRERGRETPEPLSKPQIKITEDGEITGIKGDRKFRLNSLRISGCTVFEEDELLKPYRHMMGRPISFSQLSAITSEMTKKYRDNGYLLSRVIIPAQEVEEDGADIRLHVVEGYIEDIKFIGEGSFKDRFEGYFAPVARRLTGRKPLNHKDFERYMLLMRDIPGLEISSRFEKGQAPGASSLILEVDNKPVDLAINYGNTGTDSAGPFIGSASMSLNNIPFVGSQTSASYSQANNYQEYWTVYVAERYQMWNGLTFTASYAHSDSPEMDTEFARDFDYRSKSDTFNVGVSWPFIRSRDLNLSAGLNFEHRNSNSYIWDERFTRDHLRAASGNINLDFADATGAVTQLSGTVYRGLNIWDSTDYSIMASNTLAPAEYWKWDIYASRNQYLPHNLSVFTQGEIQLSNDSLSSYNRFYLGGSRFGRGYEPGVVEGDNGFAISLEPRWTFPLTGQTQLQLFSFVDWGTVWTNKSVWGVPDQQTLSSAGGGIRLWGHEGNAWLPDFNITAYIGQPLQQIRGDSDFYATRFVFQVGLYF